MIRRTFLLAGALLSFVGSDFSRIAARADVGTYPAEAGRHELAEAGRHELAEAGRHGLTVVSADTLPARLSDRQFWKLFSDLSEPGGTFKSDNLLSNEIRFQVVIPNLMRIAKPGGVYIGVGPEQNFTYIAAIKPKLAFIVDVRRGNADLHLMYKALFELSADRAEFVSRLFSRRRPPGLDAQSTASEIFDAYSKIETNERVYIENLATIRHRLVTAHRFPLSGDDLQGIEAIYHVFFLVGPRIQYSPIGSFGGTVQPSYADLMAATDERGEARGFLATEQTFAFVKDLERRNAIVPIVGNFAGAKAIRGLGNYVRKNGATVSAFYVSNVEDYLHQDRIWQDFCANVATLPVDDASPLIRAVRVAVPEPPGSGFAPRLDNIASEVKQCAALRQN